LKHQGGGIVTATFVMVSAICIVLFAITAVTLITGPQHSLWVELRLIGGALGFGFSALISLGCLLFLKAK
jgi:hypothetical protein